MKEALAKFFEAIARVFGGGKIDDEINAESKNAVCNKAIYSFVKNEIGKALFADEGSEAT